MYGKSLWSAGLILMMISTMATMQFSQGSGDQNSEYPVGELIPFSRSGIAGPLAIHSHWGLIDIGYLTEIIPSHEDDSASDYWIVQFNGPIGADERIELERTGDVIMGNLPDSYTVSMRDQADELIFDSSTKQVRVPEGQTLGIEFSAVPRQFRLFGGEKHYPFQASVQASNKESISLSGELVGKGLVPTWVIGVLVVFCIVFSGIAAMLIGGAVNRVAHLWHIDCVQPAATGRGSRVESLVRRAIEEAGAR